MFNTLVNVLKAGKMPQELGKITERKTHVRPQYVKKLLDEVYRRVLGPSPFTTLSPTPSDWRLSL